MDFVVDASVAMGWLLQSQANSMTVAVENSLVRDHGWVAHHFGIEVLRTLRGHERRGLITAVTVDNALVRLRELPLRQDVEDALESLETVVALARRHRLRVSDAAYLELALRTGLPLATRDAGLAQAAGRAGAVLFTA
jgi:predicted nucleic acid-binding protein